MAADAAAAATACMTLGDAMRLAPTAASPAAWCGANGHKQTLLLYVEQPGNGGRELLAASHTVLSVDGMLPSIYVDAREFDAEGKRIGVGTVLYFVLLYVHENVFGMDLFPV